MSLYQMAYKAAAHIGFNDNGSDTIDSAMGDRSASCQHGIDRLILLCAQAAKTAALVIRQR